jgi:hypothetical protein
MTKRNKVKTTLDKRHKDKVSHFESHELIKQSLETELDTNLNELKNIEKIPYIDYTNDIIEKKTQLLDDNKEINKKLEKIESSLEELLYYNNTIDYIIPYYEQNNKQGGVKHMEIVDFFNNSNLVKKKKSSNNKAELLEKYLKVTDNKQVKVGKYKKFKPKFCSNADCKAEMTLHLSDGYLICTKCGFCEEVILDSDKPNYKEPVPDATAYSYKRINHFNEWLAQFQAKESTDIPDEVYDKILVEMKKQRLLDKFITPKKMRSILKKLGYNKYYEHVQHIINKVSGIPPPKMTREVEEKFRQMFKQCQEPFTIYCPKNRKNFLSYSYTLHKFCELLELNDFLPCFPLLKSQDKLKEQDRIWKKICNYLNWEYVSSI